MLSYRRLAERVWCTKSQSSLLSPEYLLPSQWVPVLALMYLFILRRREAKPIRHATIPHFHFVALVSFLALPKPRIPFLCLSLLRNQAETLATQARFLVSQVFSSYNWRTLTGLPETFYQIILETLSTLLKRLIIVNQSIRARTHWSSQR